MLLLFLYKMFQPTAGDRPGVSNIAIIITDGRSNNETATWLEAKLTRGSNVTLIGVGIGKHVRQRELEGIASYPVKGNVLYVANFMALNQSVDRLLNTICNSKL